MELTPKAIMLSLSPYERETLYGLLPAQMSAEVSRVKEVLTLKRTLAYTAAEKAEISKGIKKDILPMIPSWIVLGVGHLLLARSALHILQEREVSLYNKFTPWVETLNTADDSGNSAGTSEGNSPTGGNENGSDEENGRRDTEEK